MVILKRKNDEAPATCDSQGLLSNKSREGNIDMNSVQKKELTFHNVALIPAPVPDGLWLTSSDIAKALGYASSKSVSTIYSRNSDEFTSSMSMVIKMKTNAINNNLRDKSVRVFSLRGCHLIAMFATTDKAKEFRRWVLDILDREVMHSPIAQQFSDEELRHLCWLWKNSTRMLDSIADIAPLLRIAEHRLAPAYTTMPYEYPKTLEKCRSILKRETSHVNGAALYESDWRVLYELRAKEFH